MQKMTLIIDRFPHGYADARDSYDDNLLPRQLKIMRNY